MPNNSNNYHSSFAHGNESTSMKTLLEVNAAAAGIKIGLDENNIN